MAAPNIVNSATIVGETDVLAVPASLTAITTNAGASGKVYKINSLIACNITNNTEIVSNVSVAITRSATDYYVVSAMAVPATSTLVIISKDMGIYLAEGDTLKISASATSQIEALCSYETIAD